METLTTGHLHINKAVSSCITTSLHNIEYFEMRVFNITYWLILAVAFISCTTGEQEQMNERRIISFSVDAEVESRAATDVLSNKFSVNNQFAIYINEVTAALTPSVEYEQPMRYRITDTEGTMKPVNSPNPYYPASGNPVSVVAVFPYIAVNDNHLFEIQSNQNEKSGYQNSDLMYATLSGRNLTGDLVLSFRHLTSKITVVLTTSQEKTNLEYSKVSIINTMTQAVFDATVNNSVTASGNTDKKILISNNGSEACSGVILPQNISAGTRLIEIELISGEKVYGVLPSIIAFEAGKSYTFNIDVVVDRVASTITLNNIEVTDWVDAYTTPQEIKGY